MEDGKETCCPRLDREPWHWPRSLFSEPPSQTSQARVKRHPQRPPWPLPWKSPPPAPSGCTCPPPLHCAQVHFQDPVAVGHYLFSGHLSEQPPQECPSTGGLGSNHSPALHSPSPSPTFWVKIFISLFLKTLLNFLKTLNFFSAEREGAVFLFFGVLGLFWKAL